MGSKRVSQCDQGSTVLLASGATPDSSSSTHTRSGLGGMANMNVLLLPGGRIIVARHDRCPLRSPGARTGLGGDRAFILGVVSQGLVMVSG